MSRPAPSGRVVYAGRHAPLAVAGGEVLSEWDAAPRRLLPALAAAESLVLLDPISFPFDALRAGDRDIPVVAVLEPAGDRAVRRDLLATRLFEHLGPGDRLVADDEDWDDLRGRFGWAEGMRLEADPSDPAGAAARALGPGMIPSREAKARGRCRAESLAWLLEGAAGSIPRGTVLRTIDVDGAAGPWVRHWTGAEWHAVGRAQLAEEATESADVVVAFGLLPGLAPGTRRDLVREMWRVARPTGRLMLVDDAVPKQAGDPDSSGCVALQRLLLGATGRRVVLDRVHSHRYPGDAARRGAALAAVKTGAPQRW